VLFKPPPFLISPFSYVFLSPWKAALMAWASTDNLGHEATLKIENSAKNGVPKIKTFVPWPLEEQS
jgi:hypothetical protein